MLKKLSAVAAAGAFAVASAVIAVPALASNDVSVPTLTVTVASCETPLNTFAISGQGEDTTNLRFILYRNGEAERLLNSKIRTALYTNGSFNEETLASALNTSVSTLKDGGLYRDEFEVKAYYWDKGASKKFDVSKHETLTLTTDPSKTHKPFVFLSTSGKVTLKDPATLGNCDEAATDNAQSEPKTDAAQSEPKTDAAQSEPKTDAAQSEPKTDAAQSEPKTDAAQSEPKTDAAQSEPKTDAAQSEPKTDAAQSEPKTDAAQSEPKTDAAQSEPKTDEAQSGNNTAPKGEKPSYSTLPTKSDAGVKVTPSHEVKVVGTEITFTADGFKPGEVVKFFVHSEPVYVGSAVADAKGVATIKWNVPVAFELGKHHVTATGDISKKTAVNEFHLVKTEKEAKELQKKLDGAKKAAAKQSSTNPKVAKTGLSLMVLASGAAVAAAGAGATVIARRRNS